MAVKASIRRISGVIEEVIRYLSLRFVLASAAYVLPRKWAMGIADVLSLLLVISPETGPRVYWEMRRIYGKGRFDSFRLAWGWLGRGYRDFVIYKRIIFKREDPLNWQIIERNVDNIRSLRESGESYIVASGHFLQALSYSMYSPTITYGRVFRVANPLLKRNWKLKDLRIRYQVGMHHKAFSSCYKRGQELIFVESMRAAKKIFDLLCERGNVVFIDVDAWTESKAGSYERPFAGHRGRVFATGTAQLARIARCSIISCVYWLEHDATIALEWGTPIRNTINKPADDINVMNKLIDTLELAIGQRPTQYALEIGGERRWNLKSKRWEELN